MLKLNREKHAALDFTSYMHKTNAIKHLSFCSEFIIYCICKIIYNLVKNNNNNLGTRTELKHLHMCVHYMHNALFYFNLSPTLPTMHHTTQFKDVGCSLCPKPADLCLFYTFFFIKSSLIQATKNQIQDVQNQQISS